MKKTGKIEIPSLEDLSIKLRPEQNSKIAVKSVKNRFDALTCIRGNVLACTAHIEFKLDGVLEILFLGSIPEFDYHIARSIHFIFKKTRLSLGDKIQLLKQLLPHSKPLKDINATRLISNLTEIAKTGGYLSNRHAIPNSWDVPLIICATKSGKRPELLIDFMPVTEFVVLQNLGSSDVFLSTIVHDSAKTLSKELDKNNLKFSSAKKYALRVFVEDYLCFGKPKN